MEHSESKENIRKELMLARKREHLAHGAQDEARFCAFVTSLPQYRAAKTVFCYVSYGSEPATRALLRRMWQDGKQVVVPRCEGGGVMKAKHVASFDELQQGMYGILEPAEHAPELPFSQIDLAVVPCVACDRSGMRLGRGGGYYDRFLSASPAYSVSLCYHALVLPAVPCETHDRAVNAVITERGITLAL